MAAKKAQKQDYEDGGQPDDYGPDGAIERPGILSGVTSAFSSAYFSVEDRYYSAMGFFDKLGIPTNKFFVDPIESRGIPSLPFAALILLVLAAGAYFSLFSQDTATVSISLVSASGDPVSEANVTLSLDSDAGPVPFASRISDYGGSVTFDKVPLGRNIWVSVIAEDYADYSNLLAPFSNDRTSETLTLEPVEASVSRIRFSVLVVDSEGLRLLAAKVGARYVNGTQMGAAKYTDATGSAQVLLGARQPFFLDVEKEGYTKVQSKLEDPAASPSDTVMLSEMSPNSRTATVVVNAMNSQGDPVSSEVTLYSEGSTILGQARTSSGQASFGVPFGTKFSVSAEASGDDAGKYFPFASAALSVASGEVNRIDIVFEPKANGTGYGNISVRVLGEDGSALDADVKLYSEGTNILYATRKATAAVSGLATFEVSAASSFYATAGIDGYIPATAKTLRAGSATTLVLKKSTAANNASVLAYVRDSDGKTPAAGASVYVLSTDGSFAGYSPVVTNADGKAFLSGLEAGNSFSLLADKPPKKGTSARFTAVKGAVANATIVLKADGSKIIAAASDAVSGTPIEATFVARSSGAQQSSCTTSSYNLTCELPVPSGTEIIVTASASGHELTTSGTFVLSPSESRQYTATLLSSSLRSSFRLQFLGLFNSAGNASRSVERDSSYEARFLLNFPQANSSASGAPQYKAGVLVRVGTVGNENRSSADPAEHFFLTPAISVQQAVPLLSYTYSPSSAQCDSDLANAYNSDGYYKWISYEYPAALGVQEISVRVGAKKLASAGEKMRIEYAGWLAFANSTYVHFPADPDLGAKQTAATKDWCYAKTAKTDFSVVAGTSSCGGSACISIDFSNGTDSFSNKYSGPLKLPVYASVQVSASKTVSIPKIMAGSARGQLQILNYSVTTALSATYYDAGRANTTNFTLGQFFDAADLWFNITAPKPTDFAEFAVTFLDNSTQLARSSGYVTLAGAGRMYVDVVPNHADSQKAQDFNVTITDALTGKPVTDAQVSFNESKGSPFSGALPSGVLGGSQSDPSQGTNGKYFLKKITPTQKGTFDIVAKQPDYATASKSIVVGGYDFLYLSSGDIDACADDRPIVVGNNLSIDSDVVISSSSANCVVMASCQCSSPAPDGGPAQVQDCGAKSLFENSSSYSFTLPAESTARFVVSPAGWAKSCNIIIAGTARDGSKSSRSLHYANCKQYAVSDFLSVSPSRLVNSPLSGRCDKPVLVNISNDIPSSSPGAMNVSITGEFLSVKYDSGSVPLGTPSYLSMAHGSKVSVLIQPTKKNSTTQLRVAASDAYASASVIVNFENCPEPGYVAPPKIMYSSPSNFQSSYDGVAHVSVTTDKQAVCRIGNSDALASQLPDVLNYKSRSGSSYTYAVDISQGSDPEVSFSLPFGRSTLFAGCCNNETDGGNCQIQKANISFTLPAPNPSPSPRPSATPRPSPSPNPSPSPTASPSPTPGPTSGVIVYRIPPIGSPSNLPGPYFKDDSSSNANAITSIDLSVSSIIPIAGFVLRVQNTEGNARNVNFGLGTPRLGIYALDGSKAPGSISVPAHGSTDFIVTYPELTPATFQGNEWGAFAGYRKNDDGTLVFSAEDASLSMGDQLTSNSLAIKTKVVDTDNVAFGLGLFDETNKLFVPFGKGKKEYDAYFKEPKLGESYRVYAFSNILNGMPGRLDYAGASNIAVKNGYSEENHLAAVVPASAIGDPVSLRPIYYSDTRRSNFALQGAMPKFAVDTDTAGKGNHGDMLSHVNDALKQLQDLKKVLESSNIKSNGAPVNFLKILGLGNQKAIDAGGALSDIFITSDEGATLRVLWMQYDPSTMTYKAAKDITPTFEYPGDLKTESTIGLLAPPYQKYLLAYPGNKHNLGYLCPPGETCGTPETSLYVKDGIYRDGTADEKAAIPNLAGHLKVLVKSDGAGGGSGGCSGSLFSNPASGVTEDDAQYCCISKTSRFGKCLDAGSNDACVITASNQWLYVNSDGTKIFRGINQGECGSTDCTDCFGHNCDQTHAESSNFNGGDPSKGFDPHALTSPYNRCFTYQYSIYRQECISPDSCQMCMTTCGWPPVPCMVPCGTRTRWPLDQILTEVHNCGEYGSGCDESSHNAFPDKIGGTNGCLRTDVRCSPCQWCSDEGSCGSTESCPNTPVAYPGYPGAPSFTTICQPQTICSVLAK